MLITIPTRVRVVSQEETDALMRALMSIQFTPKKGFLLDRPIKKKVRRGKRK